LVFQVTHSLTQKHSGCHRYNAKSRISKDYISRNDECSVVSFDGTLPIDITKIGGYWLMAMAGAGVSNCWAKRPVNL